MYKKTYRVCCHCNKEIVSSRHKDHESKCLRMQADAEEKRLANRKAGRPFGGVAWNKGLTVETDERVKRNGEAASNTIQTLIANGQWVPRRMSQDARVATSERMSLSNPGGRCKWYTVAGRRVQGTYEKHFAECLESEGIVWEKIRTNNRIFKYLQNGKIRSYAPDFYLPELGLYVEIKGFWWGDDEHKMMCIKEQHRDKNVVVLFGKNKLEAVCKSIKVNLPLEPVWSW